MSKKKKKEKEKEKPKVVITNAEQAYEYMSSLQEISRSTMIQLSKQYHEFSFVIIFYTYSVQGYFFYA